MRTRTAVEAPSKRDRPMGRCSHPFSLPPACRGKAGGQSAHLEPNVAFRMEAPSERRGRERRRLGPS